MSIKIIELLFPEYITCKYDANLTELECNKCGDINIEWYNDQPGDRCLKVNCKGKYIRVLKK